MRLPQQDGRSLDTPPGAYAARPTHPDGTLAPENDFAFVQRHETGVAGAGGPVSSLIRGCFIEGRAV